ncbi:leukocyte receptor cluster member 9 [Megalobrama amblycephala]|uniref:leukocyte receptor cluster member 9 n=1 Tax=Megalobrama amblycephala TaxID=75352 RepID=UPI0020145706|nr:leukocyte receptor cluster member 9 [Megalobrama amblycephala]XP_048008392.1 leukocyte receptor cluster member 9 [Megalobrama amblycephala]
MEFEEERTQENLTEDSDRQIHIDEIKQESSRNICQHFLLGRCHFGDRCRLSHSMLDVPQTTHSEEDDTTVTEKQSKNRRNRKKMNAEKQHIKTEKEGCKKKPRMRTADDVISRIIWDSSVDPGDFVVGHLDRFLGVLERPFSDFAWDTQVVDCDFSEELALPRHRIQYFSYKGQRVWDRDSRTDRVFGSTGQTILPPFGSEDQQQENLTPDTVQHEETTNTAGVSNDLEQATEEQEDAIDHSFTKNAEEGTSDDTLRLQQESTPENKKMAATEDHSLNHLAEELSITQKEEQAEIVEEWKNSWDGASGPESEQVQLQPQSRRPPPRKPTHFICFRVDSPAALQAFQRVQKKVLSHVPQSEPLWVNPATLHVTLSLLVLNGPEEVSAAAELLRTTVGNSHKPPISVSFTPKLRHFNGTVLHVSPQPLSDVQSLNSPLQEAFKEKGWLHRHSRCPSYHLTLAKAQEPMTDKMFEGIGAVKLAKDVNFGKLEVNKLYLCVNNHTKTENGFYQVVCAVQLPNV